MATLRYLGTQNATFSDVTAFARDENGDLIRPEVQVTARVGEVVPQQVFTVPDACAEAFTRRSDIEVVEDPKDAVIDAPEDAKPARGRRVKTSPGDEDLAGDPATAGTTE